MNLRVPENRLIRGTLVFPASDPDFLRQIELRGKNGARDFVETVYVLSGSTYYVPTRLHALDDPSLFNSADRSSVNARNREMAQKVANFYAQRDGPRIVVRIHTHPSLSTNPSDTDYDYSLEKKPVYDRFFEDYEYFHGIHGIGEISEPPPGEIRSPEMVGQNELAWWGESRRHRLAIYDEEYDPRPVVLPQP